MFGFPPQGPDSPMTGGQLGLSESRRFFHAGASVGWVFAPTGIVFAVCWVWERAACRRAQMAVSFRGYSWIKTLARGTQGKTHKQIKAGQLASFLRLFTSRAGPSLHLSLSLYMVFYFRKNTCIFSHAERLSSTKVWRMNKFPLQWSLRAPARKIILKRCFSYFTSHLRSPKGLASPRANAYHFLALPPAVPDTELLTDRGRGFIVRAVQEVFLPRFRWLTSDVSLLNPHSF